MSFKCMECGADNKDVEVTNGRVRSNSTYQTCRSSPTKVKYKDIRVFCTSSLYGRSGCYSTTSIDYTSSALDHLRQIHKEEDLYIMRRLCNYFLPKGYDHGGEIAAAHREKHMEKNINDNVHMSLLRCSATE